MKEELLNKIERIFTETQNIIDEMSVGDRIKSKDMAAKVTLKFSEFEPMQVLSFVNFYLHNIDCGYVSAGKFGGFIKGVRPVKIKKAKVTKAVGTTTNSDIQEDIEDKLISEEIK